MDEFLEPKLDLGFPIAREFRAELIRHWHNCWDTRDRGMEYRMDHGIALREIKDCLKEHLFDDEMSKGFARICELLESSEEEANRRIRMAEAWTFIKAHLEDRGLNTPLPRLEGHLLTLSEEVKAAQIGETWVKIYHSAEESRRPVTSRYIKEWVENHKSLPAPDTEPGLGEGEIDEDEEESEGEIDEDEEEETKEETKDEKAPGSGPDFKGPPGLQAATERIIRLCAGTNPSPEAVESWRRTLSGDTIRIKFDQILRWDAHSDEDVRKIGRLWSASEKGLDVAIRSVESTIDDNSRLWELKQRCLAEGHRYEYVDGSFRILVTFTK